MPPPKFLDRSPASHYARAMQAANPHRTPRFLLLTILAVILLVSARGEHQEQTVNRLLRSVRAELPKGWTASYDKTYAWLEISRDKAVLCESALPNGPSPPRNLSEECSVFRSASLPQCIPPNIAD
jgi:hypothetical protein